MAFAASALLSTVAAAAAAAATCTGYLVTGAGDESFNGCFVLQVYITPRPFRRATRCDKIIMWTTKPTIVHWTRPSTTASLVRPNPRPLSPLSIHAPNPRLAFDALG